MSPRYERSPGIKGLQVWRVPRYKRSPPGMLGPQVCQVPRYEGVPSYEQYPGIRGPHVSDFCESKFTESRDREWDFSWKFLRFENENESYRGKIESREWEWEFRGNIESQEWEFWGKNRVEFWYETLESSRMGVRLRLRVHCSMTFSIEIFMIEASNGTKCKKNTH